MTCRLFYILCFLFLFQPSFASDRQLSQRLVDGLLQRGMYDSAERFCDFELQKSNDATEQANFLAAEKVRVLTRRAVSLPEPQREPVLRQLEQWERQWERQENQSTKSFTDTFQFPYQLAISDLRLGDLYRLEEVTAASEAESEKRSTFFLDRARERLAQLRKTVDQRMADRTTPSVNLRELVAIQRQIDFQTALAWRSYAFGFAKESKEQIDGLQRALQGLTPLAALSGTDPILVQSRLEKATCLRLLLELDAAWETLNVVLQQGKDADGTPAITGLSETERTQAAAEGIRLYLAQGNIDQAVRWSADEPRDANPDFDLARLEAYLSQWKLASRADEEQSRPLLNRVLEFSKRVEQLHGSYWGRRAQMLVAESTKDETTGNFGIYVQIAEDAFHREQFDDAIRNYDRASDAAEQSGDIASAFRFALTAASVENRLERDHAAQKRFRDAAKKWADQEQASAAYLFGLELLRKSVESKETPTAELIDGLVEFVQTWPQSPRRNGIAERAAALLEKEGRFQEAFEVCPEFEGYAKTIIDIQHQIAQGRQSEALRRGKELWEKHPADVVVAQMYGDLLASSDPKDGLEFWRNIEKSFENPDRTRTDEENSLYWKAKEIIIRLHIQLGNREQAKKLLDLIRLLHPEQSERFKGL